MSMVCSYHIHRLYLHIHRQMRYWKYLFDGIPAAFLRPVSWRLRIRLFIYPKLGEPLQQADEIKCSFVIRELLSKTYPGTSVKRTEDVRVWCEVFIQSFVEEAVRIEFESWFMDQLRWLVREWWRRLTIGSPEIGSSMQVDDGKYAAI